MNPDWDGVMKERAREPKYKSAADVAKLIPEFRSSRLAAMLELIIELQGRVEDLQRRVAALERKAGHD